ncbi:MAG: alpha/beta hydrolase [Alphaproteobacteria bacterium]
MPEVILNGAAGRLEGRYHHDAGPEAPIALILHPHPQFGGTMNNPIVFQLYYTFVKRGFSVMRFNFRGVGRSQGLFDNGPGELADAATALDWIQRFNAESRGVWIAGMSFGSWIAMQLLMRRPEIEGFISVAPPASHYDFSFLAPCPSSGLMVTGSNDAVVSTEDAAKLVDRLKLQKGIVINHTIVKGANHFFEDRVDELMGVINTYLDKRLAEIIIEAKTKPKIKGR